MSFTEIAMALLSIVVIDIVLGGDNAVLIALASKNLPGQLRKKAMFWGVAGAVAIRGLLASVALYVLKIPFLQFAGGVLLVWIAVKLLVEKREINCDSGTNLIEAIKIIIMADVVMGIDNVLAIAGAAHGSVWMVLVGLTISVPIIVWGSSLLLKWMDRYPVIIYVGAAVLAWTAGKMMVSDKIVSTKLAAFIPYYAVLLPVLVLVGVLLFGYIKNRTKSPQVPKV